MVVDEVSSVAILLTVEVGLRECFVRKEIVWRELENELEARAVEILHADVRQVSEGFLVLIRDKLSKRNLVLHCRQPELWNTLCVIGRIDLYFRLLILSLVFVLFRLAGFHLSLCWFAVTIDDLGPLLVQWCEFGKVFLFEVQNFFLELSLKFGVFLLNAFEASNSTANRSWEVFNVARRTTNKCTKLSLYHRHEGWVLSEDRGSSGAVKILCHECQSKVPTGLLGCVRH
jgi:hypothetical protein